ncbi:hypothetical protein TD95_004724 [Thielaviopsis punctulata]|uniref:Signal recognition particle subunit SRP72 n=1 Tax=Thielaviopsis punctulata TaxID=72032 RepID=A0A0F4ZDI7_9PEZI|nr:hypothetical protein TD95_004724 [Thielaviopsis punctulata]
MAPSLVASLKAATIDDHGDILDAANAALKSSKSDSLALQTRVIALIKLDRYEDALRAVAEGGDSLKAQCIVETAYALYKTGQLDEAAKMIAAAANKTDAVKHLDGQIAYRAERFEDAWNVYNGFDDTNEDGDLIINKLAVLAQLGWQGKGSDDYAIDVKSIVAFEVAYNLACFNVSKGNLLTALQLLQLARRLCDQSDDLSDEEKQSELVPILVQQVYVYSRLGLSDKALEIQKLLTLTDDCGDDTKALAKTNSIILSSSDVTNPFLARRSIESSIHEAKGQKLFEYQFAALRQLQLVLDLAVQKFKGSQNIAKEVSLTGPDASAAVNGFAPIGVAAASWMSPEKALATAAALFSKRSHDAGLALTLIQLSSQTGQTASAINYLETFFKSLETAADDKSLKVRYAPGIVAVAVSLYNLAGRSHVARAELGKAAAFWQKHPGASARSLLVEAGLELLKSDKEEDLKLASETFTSLMSSSANNEMASAGLVAALASSDEDKAKALATDIPTAKALTKSIDAQALLDAGVAANPKTACGTKRAAPSTSAPSAPAKKRRHRKLPANYEEGKQPDPERWLPLRDRSTYRPKGGKKGKKKAEALTQGGVVKGEETLELVGGAGAVKVEKAPQVSGAAKKKKKGRK